MKYTPRLGVENIHTNVVESVKDLDLSSNISILDVYQYKRDIVAAILAKMIGKYVLYLFTTKISYPPKK
jgi:hypothetical protein